MAKTGLALSGGGLRGLAHIGVLKVIEKLGIKIHAVSGSSIGSIFAYLFAAGKTSEEIEEFVLKYNLYELIDFSLSKLGIKKFNKLKNILEEFTGITTFEELNIPLYINSTNLTKGKQEVFSKGNIFEAIRASIAVPGLFAPIKKGNDYYVDGGVLNHAPIDVFPKEIKKIIIVKIHMFRPVHHKQSLNLGTVVKSTIHLMQEQIFELRLRGIKNKYVLIEPDLSNFLLIIPKKKFSEVIKIGQDTALCKLSELKKLFKK